jgi:hypothetical protein
MPVKLGLFFLYTRSLLTLVAYLSKVGKAGKGANVKPKEVRFFFFLPPLFSGTFFKARKNERERERDRESLCLRERLLGT